MDINDDFIKNLGLKSNFTNSPIKSQAELYQFLDMNRASSLGEDIFSGNYSLEKYISIPNKSKDEIIFDLGFRNTFTNRPITNLEEFYEFKKMFENAHENKGSSLFLLLVTLILCCIISGVLMYLVRVFLWGNLILELYYWISNFNIPTLLILCGILPLGGFTLWVGIFIPLYSILLINKAMIGKINTNNFKNIQRSLKGVGIFNILASILGLCFWIFISIYNPIDIYIVVSYICVAIQFIIGLCLFKSNPDSLIS